MLIIRPCQPAMKSGDSRRMKPARQTKSHVGRAQHPIDKLRVETPRGRDNRDGEMAWVGDASDPRASSRPPHRPHSKRTRVMSWRSDSLTVNDCGRRSMSAPYWSRARKSELRASAAQPWWPPARLPRGARVWATATVRPFAGSIWPIAKTVSPALAQHRRSTASTLGRCDTSTMPMPQLNVRAISRIRWPPRAGASLNTAALPVPGIESAARPCGQHARNILEQAAAGDMGEGLDLPLRTAASSGLDINAGRASSRASPSSARCRTAQASSRDRCRPRSCAPANSRWNARREEARPSTTSPGAIICAGRYLVALDRADGKTGKIVIASAYMPGISAVSPPTSAQPACWQPSAMPATIGGRRRPRVCRWRNSRERAAARRPER